ncbi:ParB/RepB/Spo0J family partition protein [Kribbella catacumbae]|uniref:ParB/RepB/Spo0J family partition protein n=1 Tax=Kribbella catacumbae TaxID=460086 RepID=UPI00036AB684|nr:ParB N-terminal domain-containing protein [Kribbella catacumbae]
MTTKPINNINQLLDDLRVPIDSIQPHPKNAKKGDIPKIAGSLTKNGQYRAIVVRQGSNEILAGNHTWKAAKTLGWTQIAAQFVDVDDETALRILLVDNKSAEDGTYDQDVLAEVLDSLSDLDGTGYTDEDLAAMIGSSLEVDELPGSAGLGEPVIAYEIVFDTDQQQARWYAFLRWLKSNYHEHDTIGERLAAYVADQEIDA